jgi:hypothetical protein
MTSIIGAQIFVEDQIEMPDLDYRAESYTDSTGETKTMVHSCSDEGKRIMELVVNTFDDNILSMINGGMVALSKDVVTTNSKSPLKLPILFRSELKMNIKTKEVAIKESFCYTNEPVYIGLPPCELIGISKFKPIEGYPFTEKYRNMQDLYFSCDHKKFCEFFNVNLPQGEFRTYGSVSYDIVTKEIFRIKSYTYNTNNPRALWTEIRETALARQHFFGDQQ